MATYGSWQATIQNEFGDILPGSEVEVFLESTGLAATIYSGRTGGALANPFFADPNGFSQFYAAPGEYRIVATDGGSGFTNTWRYEEIGAILSIENTQIANYLANANLNTTIVNQEGFGGGQPAAGVYGYDMWKGDTLGTRIEQVVENTEVINESFTISWVGGTGTADVDGTTGLNSGDSFTLNTNTNFSVIIPTDATYIVVNKGDFAIPFPVIDFGVELAKCEHHFRYLTASDFMFNGHATATDRLDCSVPAPTTMRAVPSLVTSGSASDYNIQVGGTVTACTSVPISLGLSGESIFGVRFAATGGVSVSESGVCFSANANGFLAFNARL